MTVADTIEQALWDFKQIGMYAINTFMGGDIGCDDLGVPLEELDFQVTAVPVGVLGESRVLWRGTAAQLREVDWKAVRPTVVSNPPGDEIGVTEHGFWIWGTDYGVKRVLERIWPESPTTD